MKKIYIVEGHTGVYSDKRFWFVKAFTDIDRALDYSRLCGVEATRVQKYMRDNDIEPWDHLTKAQIQQCTNIRDIHMSLDYNGAHYSVSECELED